MSDLSVEASKVVGFRMHNPDVLTCIANLSNDEVFTPPELANQMLDSVERAWAEANGGANIWADTEAKFLDPFTKSGVFLREITRRLTEGLKHAIPNLEERVDHILTNQVFGIGITQLTALLARRSLYCSKDASGKHSIATGFDREWGNVWFERTEHAWSGGKLKHDLLDEVGAPVAVERQCRFCGAQEEVYDRSEDVESHAYAFIHADDIKARIAEIFGIDMQFDVIIGNPPYQMSDGGAGTSAKPIYQHFIKSAQDLDSRYIVMITPSRWVAGGKGLNSFRESMLKDLRLREMVDFLNASDAFPGVDVAGGVSYFLWDRDYQGLCRVTTVRGGESVGPIERKLDEFDVFVRHARSVEILHKVWPTGVDSAGAMSSEVSARMAFGFPTNARGVDDYASLVDPIELVSSSTGREGKRWVERSEVPVNSGWVDEWKSTVGGAAPAGGRPDRAGRYYGLSSVRVLGPGVACTESYIVAGHFSKEEHASNLDSYLRTKFVRFLVSLRAVTQHVTRASFGFVPVQDFGRGWADADLYEKYALEDDEIAFIEGMVRPMGASDV